MFKKSQSVILIRRWNDDGQFFITPAVVVSCGKKQMVLQNPETGVCLGRNFKPSVEQYCDAEVRADLSIEQARERAVELSVMWLAREIERTEMLMARNAGDAGFVRAMQKNLDRLRAATACCRD